MKNKIIILGLIFSVAFSSCTDWLNPKPLDSLVGDDHWKTKDDVVSAVYACYEAMTEPDYIRRIILAGEVRSDNVIAGPTNPNDGNDLRDLLDASIQPDNRYARWLAFYKVIGYCNSVIKYAPEVCERDPDYTEGLLKIDLAEAHALRALTYFYLARLYKEFPYEKLPFSDDTQDFRTAASPGDSVLREELILLENIAEPSAVRTRGNSFSNSNMATSIAVQNKGRVTKTMVRALMADIYLWLEMYEECETICNKVLDDVLTRDQYNLLDHSLFTGAELFLSPNDNSDDTHASEAYRRVFLGRNSPESIFELQFTSLNREGVTAIRTMYGFENTRWFHAPPDMVTGWNIFDNSDLRRTDNINKTGTANTDPALLVKYVGEQMGRTLYYYYSENSSLNWIFYRLSDIYLMKAEALVEMGESRYPEAIELINTIYTRSNLNRNLNPSNYSGLDEMRELVLLERHREFMFEGKRWFDLFRQARKDGTTTNVLSKYILRKYKDNAGAVESKLRVMDSFYMPIHKDELISNPKLNQNPFYDKDKILE